MARSRVVLSGKALAIAADLYTVGMNANKAQAALEREYETKAQALLDRTNAANLELMDSLFNTLEWPLDDKPKWAIDVRYVEDGFAVLIPIKTTEEAQEAEATEKALS